MLSKEPVIVSVVGARPQFIKLAPLAPVMSRSFRHIIVHSGQHYDYKMSQVFFKQLHIPRPHYNLNVGSGSHGRMTGRIIQRLEEVLIQLKPAMTLVYGDTNTTLAGALTAAKLRIPVGHIEAGLRSYRMDMPEEINRRLADQISSLLFCPTENALRNLKREGITERIIHTGDLMYELLAGEYAKIKANRAILEKYSIAPKQFLLVTIHRADNSDSEENLSTIVSILANLTEPVVFPVHPRTEGNLRRFGLWRKINSLNNVRITEPLSYFDNMSLIIQARAVLTDSGGIQKEAAFVGTPCLTLRNETEWPETLTRGNFLSGLSQNKIKARLSSLPRLRSNINSRVGGRHPSTIISLSLKKYLRER